MKNKTSTTGVVLICVILLLVVLEVKFEWSGNAGYKNNGDIKPNSFSVYEKRLERVTQEVGVHGKNIQTIYDNQKDLERISRENKEALEDFIKKLKATQLEIERFRGAT